MNILFFSEPTYPLHPGGAGKCTHLLATGLAARNHEVAIVCPMGGGDAIKERIGGVEVHRVPVGTRKLTAAGGEAATAAAILDYIEATIPLSGVDVLHDSGGFLSYFYPVEFHLRARLGIPLVVHFQFLNLGYQLALSELGLSPGVLSMESGVADRVQCFPVRLADAVIFPSFEEASLGCRLFRPPPERVAVVPNPVSVGIHPPSSRLMWRERLAPAGEQLVVFGGRIDSPMKGADLVAAAFARILAARPNARLVLLNSGAQIPPAFQRLANSLVPLGWAQRDVDVAGIISAADVVLVPSRYEPFGMMCAEAMAAGVPVVATATGGLREMIVHGRNGVLLRARDARQLELDIAAYVVLLLQDAELRKRLGDNARRSVAERFSIDSVVDALEAIYRTLPQSRSGRGVAAPVISSDDRDRYLSLLERIAGADGRRAGERVLGTWHESIESRCLGCNKGQLAREGLALLAIRGRESLDREELQWTVNDACPLGLLQRSVVNRRKIAAQV